jgi:hypothetical protein
MLVGLGIAQAMAVLAAVAAPDARPAEPGPPSAADTAALVVFWEIYDLLRQGREPDENHWARLASTGGYAKLGKRLVETLRGQMRLAYLPSRRVERETLLQRNDPSAATVRHLLRAAEERARCPEILRLLDFASIVEAARARALPHLPTAAAAIRERPPVYLVIYQPTAHANNDALEIDVFFADAAGREGLVTVVAHELHHFFALRLRRVKDPPEDDDRFGVSVVLDRLALEGTADMVDKQRSPVSFPFPGSEDYRKTFQAEYTSAPARLAAVDAVICRAARRAATWRQADEAMRAHLWDNGHPVGFYMANVIKDALGREALLASVGDPFEFFAQFNKAARKAKGSHVFSACSQKFVHRLGVDLRKR